MAVISWDTPGTFTDLLTTQLDSLADTAGSALGAEYDNRTNLYLFGDFVLNGSWASAPGAGTVCDLYMVCKTDNTNYEDGSSTIRPPNSYVGSYVLRAATPEILSIRGFPLPPSKFKLTLYNGAGQAFSGSGSKVSVLPYNYKSV